MFVSLSLFCMRHEQMRISAPSSRNLMYCL